MNFKIVRPYIAVLGFALCAGSVGAQTNDTHGSDALRVYYSDLNQTLAGYQLTDVPFQRQQITVERGDTLLEIAKEHRFRELDFYHLATAIYETNAQAFDNGEASQLRVGATLTLPTVADLFIAQGRYERLKVVGEDLFFDNQENQMRQALRWPFGKSLVLIGPYAKDELPSNQEVTLTSYRPDAMSKEGGSAAEDFLSQASRAAPTEQAGAGQAADVQGTAPQVYGSWLDQIEQVSPIAESFPLGDTGDQEVAVLSDPFQTTTRLQTEEISQTLAVLEAEVVSETMALLEAEAEAERTAALEADAFSDEMAAREAEADRVAAQDADRAALQAAAEADRIALLKAEADAARIARQEAAAEADRIALQEAEAKADRIASQEATAEADRIALQEAAAEADRIALQEAAAEADRLALQEAAAEADRIALQEAAAEADRLALQEAAAEADSLALQEAAAEADRLALQEAAAEEDRIALEKAAAEADRMAEAAAAEKVAVLEAEAALEKARVSAAQSELVAEGNTSGGDLLSVPVVAGAMNGTSLGFDSGVYLGPPRNSSASSSGDNPTDPLSYIVEWRFNEDASLGNVLSKLAEYVGYELISEDDTVLNAYDRRLPEMQRSVSGITAEEGFSMLAGRGLETVFDHVARSVRHEPRGKRQLKKPLASMAANSEAPSKTATHARFMQQTGISALVRQFPADIQNAAKRHASRCESTANTQLPNTERLHSAVVSGLQQQTPEPIARQLVKWYDSPTGRKVLELERGEIDDAELQKFVIDANRVDRIQQIYNDTVTGKGIARIAVELDYSGWALSGCKLKAEQTGDVEKMHKELTRGQKIKKKFVKLESLLRTDMVRSMAYLFAPLSDSELTEYAEFARENAGIYSELQQSVVDAIVLETRQVAVSSR